MGIVYLIRAASAHLVTRLWRTLVRARPDPAPFERLSRDGAFRRRTLSAADLRGVPEPVREWILTVRTSLDGRGLVAPLSAAVLAGARVRSLVTSARGDAHEVEVRPCR